MLCACTFLLGSCPAPSSNLVAVSGEVPQSPVVSKKSGNDTLLSKAHPKSNVDQEMCSNATSLKHISKRVDVIPSRRKSSTSKTY